MANYSVIRQCSVFSCDSTVILAEDSGRSVVFDKNTGSVAVLDAKPDRPEAKFLFDCFGVLGSVTFLGHRYLVAVTEASKCGRLLLEHDVYSVRSHRLVPLFRGAPSSDAERHFVRVFKEFDTSNHLYFSYTYNLCNSLQINMSYSRLLGGDRTSREPTSLEPAASSDQRGDLAEQRGKGGIELASERVGVAREGRDYEPGGSAEPAEWLIFDPVLMEQKYCYNYSHKLDLSAANASCFNLALSVVHGYFSESVLSVSGRALTLTLISRRSRFYAGTRYRKRGITGAGHVANDVETEQLLHDWGATRAASSFVLLRGSIPTFWAQDPNESILMKPPIVYPHADPTNSSARAHFRELLGRYGAPLVVLDLLSDSPATEEGRLSRRYRRIVDELNAELPGFLRIRYFSRNIKALLERGVARQMLREVVELVAEQVGLLHLPSFDPGRPAPFAPPCSLIQSGVIRISCLDCLDRTSAFSKHLSLRMFRRQLELVGLKYEQPAPALQPGPSREGSLASHRLSAHLSDAPDHSSMASGESLRYRLSLDFPELERAAWGGEQPGFNRVSGSLFELLKARYEEMCDVLSMQYAGSKALRKYEGRSRALNVSRELFTTVRRRYRSLFEDSRIQEKANFFLHHALVSHYSALGVDTESTDLDDLIHFAPIALRFDVADSFVLPLLVYASRASLLGRLGARTELIAGPGLAEHTPMGDSIGAEDIRVGLDNVGVNDNKTMAVDTTANENTSLHVDGDDHFNGSVNNCCHPGFGNVFHMVQPRDSSFLVPEYRIYTECIDHFCANDEEQWRDGADASCPVEELIAEKRRLLRKLLCFYTSVERVDGGSYTHLSSYRPTSRVIELTNTRGPGPGTHALNESHCAEPASSNRPLSHSLERSARWAGSVASCTSEWSEPRSSLEELGIRDRSRDYRCFLAPSYPRDPSPWSLEPRQNALSLLRFIDPVAEA